METLLVIEDEKMIRRGIVAMASRSSVSIKEIIECRNGEEALKILHARKIDTVFTDIKMPKMDGIELVRRIEELPYQPDVVVISGYDDFNYAVEMLKHGVHDYLLKPVKREKIEEILVSLEQRQKSSELKKKDEELLFTNQLKYFLLSEPDSREWEPVEKQYRQRFGEKPYCVIVCTPEAGLVLQDYQGYVLENVENQKVVFLMQEYYEEWSEQTGEEGIGVSRGYSQLRECKRAYQEALAARREAFVRCRNRVLFESMKAGEKQLSQKEYEALVEQFVQQFSTKGREEAIRRLRKFCFEARHGKVEPEAFLDAITMLQRGLLEAYSHIIPEDKRGHFSFETPLVHTNLEQYLNQLQIWLNNLSGCLEEQYISDQNKRKIKEAVVFISENYMKDLNMAMVSNYVSMNYSLFSIAFKNFTGVNFVNYLKEIRIKEAKRLLRETDEKIQDISRMVGYENDKHFMKIFKNICGVSPSEYRNNQDKGKS